MVKTKKFIVIILIIVTITFLLELFSSKNSSNNINYYKKDSIFYRQRDSIKTILDTTEIQIKEIHKIYEKKIETVKHLPIDSAYIFWADYIQRFKLYNDSTATKNN